MQTSRRFEDPDGIFRVAIPEGWTTETDPEAGGVELFREDGAGSLHLLGFAAPADEVADPAEELYAFLEEQGVELEEEDVDDMELANGAEMALCEYLAEPDPEDDDEPTYWIMGVATTPGALVFASYSCAAGEEDEEREQVRAIMASLELAVR
jgi:hypothetical protein